MKHGPGDELIKAYFADPTSPEACEAIEEWALEDPANMQALADFAVTEYLLHLEQKRLDTSATLSTLLEMEDVAESEVVVLDGESPLAFKPSLPRDREASFGRDALSAGSYVLRHSLTPKNIAILAIAASLLLGVVLAIVLLSGPDENARIVEVPDQPTPIAEAPVAQRIVATLTAEQGAVWDIQPSDDLIVGQRLTLKQGFAKVTTGRGAVAILEAPASFELIDSPNAIRLYSGKLFGICETESSKGFLVRTQHLDVTDLGTHFVVDAGVSGTQVHVAQGSVQVADPNASSSDVAPAVLIAGEAVRFSSGDASFTRVAFDGGRFEAVPFDDTRDPIAQGLVAFWRFDDERQLGLNSYRNRVDLQPIGDAGYTPEGRFGGALLLDGDGDALKAQQFPEGIPSGADPFTIAMWIKPSEVGNKGMISWGQSLVNGAANGVRLDVVQGDNSLVAYFWGFDVGNDTLATGEAVYEAGVDFSEGDWTHVAVTWDGRTRRIYLNGVFTAQQVHNPPAVTAKDFAIGMTPSPRKHGVADYFNGTIDDVAIYDRALDQDVIFSVMDGNEFQAP